MNFTGVYRNEFLIFSIRFRLKTRYIGAINLIETQSWGNQFLRFFGISENGQFFQLFPIFEKHLIDLFRHLIWSFPKLFPTKTEFLELTDVYDIDKISIKT